MKRRIIMTVMVILLFLITAGMAFGEQQTLAKVDILLHTEEYKSVQLNFVVSWNRSVEDGQSIVVENTVKNYFLQHYEYQNMPVDDYIANRGNIAGNVSEYLKDRLGNYGFKINKVYLTDFEFFQKDNPQAEKAAYGNSDRPTVIYIDRPTTVIDWNWYLIVAAFIAGCCLTATMIAIFQKRDK